MNKVRVIGVLSALGLILAACAAPAQKPRVDPFPLRFPLVEVGTLEIKGHIVGQPRAKDGIVDFVTREFYQTEVVVPSRSVLSFDSGGGDAEEHKLPPLEAKIPAGPVPVYDRDGSLDLQISRFSEGRLEALDSKGQPVWDFKAGGAIPADPAVAAGHVYFGDSERMFYCLDAATGKVKWRRRLHGAALHPAVIRGGIIAVAASNSVIYRLSRRGGSILSWEAIPSRVVYEPAAAGPIVLVSSASSTVTAIDLRTGKRAGQYEASGPLVAGAVWSPPYVVLFVEDEESGRQRLVFLRSR